MEFSSFLKQLNAMRKEGKLKLDKRGCLYDPQNENQDLDHTLPDLHAMDEYFNDGYYSDIVVSGLFYGWVM